MSLWLVPHADNSFNKAVQEIISDTVPRNFLSPQDVLSFAPHVPIISDINLSDKSPQQWLDQIPLPDFKPEVNEIVLELDRLEVDDDFYRKMVIALSSDANLIKLAACCKREASSDNEDSAQKWAEKDYYPHLSLLYADLPNRDVESKVPLIEMKLGFAFGDLFACCGGTMCFGGHLVLVDTSKPVNEWQDNILARRETPWAIWRASRNLI